MSHRTTTTCSACGTSVVNHSLIFTINLLEETVGKVSDKVLAFTSNPRWEKLADFVEKCLYGYFSFFGLVRYNTDPEKAVTGRSKLIWEEAIRRGIKMEQVVIGVKPIEYYRAKPPHQKKWLYFQSIPLPPHLDHSGHRWIDDKFVLFDTLNAHNIPAPKTRKIFTLKDARKAFSELRKPVIIKPNFGSRGRHTTTNIQTEDDLIKAFRLAREITISMVMQEHLSGSVYRATVINNKLVAFFRADPPLVVGDGSQTIKGLIEEKNSQRPERLSDIWINDDLVHFIKRQNFTLESVPAEGTIVNLSAKTGRMYGGYTKEMLPEVHPKMHEIFQKAGALMHAPVVGFDMIITDPTLDPDNQRWGIIECNSLPYIDLHYFALEGTPVNLAKNVWDLWEQAK